MTDPRLKVLQWELAIRGFPRRILLRVECSDGTPIELELDPHQANSLSDDLRKDDGARSLAMVGAGGVPYYVGMDDTIRVGIADKLKIEVARMIHRQRYGTEEVNG
ncbi:MAG: hypothetical protein ACHQ50_17070 [Fimbriimonadales bacterium]